MSLYNVITILIALIAGGATLFLIRRRQLGVYHTFTWIAAAVVLILIGIFPQGVDWLGHKLGINYPPVLLIVVTLCLIVVKLLTMDIERTAHETKIRILAQKMAAYEAELRKLRGDESRPDADSRAEEARR